MGFNEKVHAFIAAKFYDYLTKEFNEQGRKAFIHATQYYAETRGRRMAQRAIRDGCDLDYVTYSQYGEWVPTSEIKEDENHIIELKSLSPDLVMHVLRCPWHIQFKEMGMTEAGHEYCQHLDNSISRGFNPYISFNVDTTLHKSDKCLFRVLDVNLDEEPMRAKKTEYLQSFEYHCAHSYWAYNEVTGAIFGEKGEEVNACVLKDFVQAYGQEMADKLVSYKHTNFNVAN